MTEGAKGAMGLSELAEAGMGNMQGIMSEIQGFIGGLNAEIEDWKISVEEGREGTRVLARVQFLIRK
jgi:hypothetical protein